MIIQINNNSGMSNLKALALVSRLERTWLHTEGGVQKALNNDGVNVVRWIKLHNDGSGQYSSVEYRINPLPPKS
jgi:hypothetical protein